MGKYVTHYLKHLNFLVSLLCADSLVLYLQFIHDGYLLGWFGIYDSDEDIT